jgi:hypothetical protein
MTAVATNVVVRLMTGDGAFTRLLCLKNVQAEDHPSIAASLILTAHGIELPDAIDLTSRSAGSTFVSFNQSLSGQRPGWSTTTRSCAPR